MIFGHQKINEACATDASRPTLTQVHYNAEKNQLEATNGSILAVVPCEKPVSDTEPLPDCLLPTEAIKLSQKLAGKRLDPVLSVVENGVMLTSGWILPINEKDKYPDVSSVTPKEGLKHVFSLDVKLLYQLARAVCDDSSRLWLEFHIAENQYGPVVVVRPLAGPEGAYGAIMTMSKTK